MDKGISGNSPETVIVVLHHNNREMTEKCLDSIIKTTPQGKYHIVVVDNASTIPFVDGPQFVNSSVIRREENLIVAAMNTGFLEALTFNPEFVMNFDNDIVCLEGWYEPLVKEMRENPKTGICGGKQWDEHQTMFRCVGYDLVGGQLAKDGPLERRDVMWLTGSAVMMRADMMRLIGVHDTRYKTLCSDSDYCLFAHTRGWDVVFVPESNVIHLQNASINGTRDEGMVVNKDWTHDNDILLKKAVGAEYYNLIKDFPIDSRSNQYVVANFSIYKRQ